jgi:hypothetical protein
MTYSRTFLMCLVLTLACSSTEGNSGNARDGGIAATGGTSSQPQGGGPSSGGASTSATGGSTAFVNGQPCSGTCPQGSIYTCIGNDCPLGRCGGKPECAAVYGNGQAGADTIYCRAGQDGEYCLSTDDSVRNNWKITCSNGTPTATHCARSCGVYVVDDTVLCE